MSIDRVKLQDIVANQLPSYVVEDFPLLPEFLQQYYTSQEYQSGPVDILKNIDQYVKVDELYDLTNSTALSSELDYISTTVNVESTNGFVDRDGIIKIDNEIIYYESKTSTSFENCSRGFSGITTYISSLQPDQLDFSETQIDDHDSGAKVYNLNILFLQQFFKRLKGQVVPGFEERSLYSGLDQRNFIFNADSFYTSKGSDDSHKILFRALYGENVEVIKPSEYLIRPSNADYKVTQDFIVERIQGNPLDLKNRTIFQDSTNARGSVTNVKQLFYDGYEFYQISIDYGYSRDINVRGSIFGTFETNPKSKVLNNVSIGQTFIDVDSAIGFPAYGELITKDIDDNIISIGYSGKTSNQFFNVTGVTGTIPLTQDIRLDTFSYAYTDVSQKNQIKVRIAASLKELELNDTNYFRPNDTVLLKSLGIEATDKKSNQWSLNIKTKFGIDTISVSDITNFVYDIDLSDIHLFNVGYDVTLVNSDRSITVDGTITGVTGQKSVTVQFNSAVNLSIRNYSLENGTLKGNSTRYPQIENFIANVQNTYTKFNGDVLVASNSVPNYNNIITNPYDRKIVFSQTVGSGIATDVISLPTNPTNLPDHGFYTGDSVFYTPGTSGFTGLTTGAYFVRRLSASTIKIARSKSDLFKDVFVSLEGTATDCKLAFNEFSGKSFSPQGIYREILPVDNASGTYITPSGFTGIFKNGIEVLNYKSQNSVYYGDIQDIFITRGGTGYDIINPPVLEIQDEIGAGATGSCNVLGSLVKFNILDPGLGYKEPPVIKITGGNGFGASAVAKLSPITYTLPFNAESSFNQVDLTENTIAFSTFSKLQDGQEVVYQPGNPDVVVGLNTDQRYFVHVVTDVKVKLHLSENDALVGINTVDLTGHGDGIQYFSCVDKKNVVTDVVVTNPGTGYENKKRTIPTSGIQTSLNRVLIKNHGYKSGEIVRYTDVSGNTRVGGLSDNTNYYCKAVDNDSFELFEIGTGNVDEDFYYKNDVVVNLTKEGDGHFNYPPIEITIEGQPAYFDKQFVSDFTTLYIIESPIEENIETPTRVLAWTDTEAEITTRTGFTTEFYVKVNGTSHWLISEDPFIGNQRDYKLKVQPIFRGSVESVDLTNPGVGYGSSEIIDFNRQPDIFFRSGVDAAVTPIINDGKISSIIINGGGRLYNSPPNLKIISETGNYARLTPIVINGKLDEIKILDGGKGYVAGKTFIEVIAAGQDARANAEIHPWNVNLFTRIFDNILDDDGVIAENIGDSSLEYSHIYAPRPLRENTFALDGFGEDNIKYGTPDLTKTAGKEVDSIFHSPIIGWAYDGNPIYGPYGFENADGSGSIIKMTSGYILDASNSNRPSFGAFESGFFVDDWKFVGNSTLDEHNGRFCVTPDYPKGVYAYFATIEDIADSSGPFENYFRPVFPYLIGNTFRSKPNNFNFKSVNNQTDYDIEKSKWFRNSYFYFTNGGTSDYDYIFNSNRIIQQGYDVTATSTGTVDTLNIQNPGKDYQVLDRVVFDNDGTGGRGLDVRVNSITGRPIESVSVATTTFLDVEFQPNNNRTGFVGYTSVPHNFSNGDAININGLSEYFKNFDGEYIIGVTTEAFNLTLGINSTSSTGIVTYFYVSGRVSRDFVKENDILSIEKEKVKVLNVDRKTRRLRVLRNQDSTVGLHHTSGTLLVENSRKFSIDSGTISTTKTFYRNREYYFDAEESIGVGTVLGVGIGTTITFSNPGVGLTQIFLQPREIYLPEHGLKLNDKLTFHMNGSPTSAEVWNGVTGEDFFFLNAVGVTTLYAAPFTSDIIGIATNKVGISSTTGEYVGLNTNSGLLFFNTTGVGITQSFKTDLNDVISARVDKNIVTVGLSQTHSLKAFDTIELSLKPLDEVNVDVRYNKFNRRIVFDPQGFTTAGVDTFSNRINLSDHGYVKGDKVIYTSNITISGLTSEGMYYVVPLTPDSFQLVENKYEVTSDNPNFISFGSQAAGTLSKINPSVQGQRNQTIKFDLSDESLSFVNGSVRYPAFKLNVYRDGAYDNNYYTTQTDTDFEVTSNGDVGVSSDAYVSVKVSDALPIQLYYKFESDNLELIPEVFEEVVIDDDVIDYTQIDVVRNEYSGNYVVSGIGSTSFDYSVASVSDKLFFDRSDAIMSYTTKSRFEKGGVASLITLNRGKGYKSLPGFTSITSTEGTGGLIIPRSDSIGNILNVRANNIGFDYPTDTTMRGVANLPEIMKVTPLLSFGRIGISSGGVNYVFAPELVVKDGFTNEVITDVQLTYELGDTEVTILENTQSLYNVTPQIVPTENTNGYSISTVSYDTASQVVRLTLTKQFSEAKDFPFVIGQNIIVENVSIGVNTTGKGYNSSDYDYDLFEITNVDAQLGGANAFVEYSLADYLTTSERPGLMVNVDTASVTPESFFPIFDPVLKISNFAVGEKVSNEGRIGIVERWDPIGQLLYVSSEDDYIVGTAVTSATTNIKSIISEIIEFDAEILTGAGATFIDGWQTDSGMLNNNLQVLPNNEYYQNFSYSLKSRIPYQTWNDPVSSLNHVAGFDKYSDLVIETSAQRIVGAIDIDVDLVVDLKSEYGINCYPDFDGASEITVDVNGTPISNQIVFDNRIIQDYFESRGNRVLKIDDISDLFDNNPREAKFQPVARYNYDQSFAKIFTFVRDTNLLDHTQFAIVDVLQNNNQGYTNQYARIESIDSLGWFDYSGISTTGWTLDFYPYDFEYNNYSVSSFSINVDSTLTGIGSTGLGDVCNVTGIHTNIAIGTTTNIVSFSSTYRAAKILVQYEDTNNKFYANELNILHDGTNVLELQYGDLTNDEELAGINGFGTYISEISGSDVIVKFVPSVSVALTATGSLVAISTSGATGVSTVSLRTANVSSYSTSISASGSPTANTIVNFVDPQAAGYFLISIEDTTNNDFELVEIAAIDTQFNEEAITQFGEIYTTSGLGTIGLTTSGTGTNVVFTPLPSIDVEVRAFGVTLQTYDNNFRPVVVELGNNQLISTHGGYVGTEYDKETAFNLNHNDLGIFRRFFNGNDSSVVNLSSNLLDLPDHYFVTGEKVQYEYENSANSSANAIGIATTTIAGVSTDKLPTELYIVKISENKVSFAQSAQSALASTPDILDITSVGLGTFHQIVATNQNAKALMAIDNMIQAPLTEVGVAATLSQAIVFDTTLEFSGIQSFKAGDIFQVDDELMKIRTIGVGSSNEVVVLRAQMGSVAVPHGIGSTANLLGGNYIIRGTRVFFESAPYGNTPIGTTTNGPDEVSWAGVTTHSTFQGRTFMRSGVEGSVDDTYEDNYTFDNIQSQFDGIKKEFTITSGGQNITGFSTNQAIILNSNILQEPQGVQFTTGDIDLIEGNTGISSIQYIGDTVSVGYDPARSSVPRGGIIVSVASTGGLGYQPLVSAGATATVSGVGTITAVSIGNSGSGYRTGIQTTVNVYAQDESLGTPSILNIGTATVQNGNITSVAISTGGSGFSQASPPRIIFDDPVGYDNIPLVYSSSGVAGVGQSATVNITVGQGSSVIDFELNGLGYGYGNGEILTVGLGGTVGIPTNTDIAFQEFQLTITDVYRDTFNGWTIGEIDVFDKLDSQFDGQRVNFSLTIDKAVTSIYAPEGSLIDLKQNLMVFINDVLQVPGEAYSFDGGSTITFSQAPKDGDTCKILFYKGTPDVDVVFVDILETVKVGDTLELKNDSSIGQDRSLDQNQRVVTGISTLDTATTNPYKGPGVTTDRTLLRPVTWCKQTDDLVLNGTFVTKDRVGLEPVINPTAFLTKNVGLTTDLVYVDSVRPLFDQENETNVIDYQFSINMTQQTPYVGASATVTVSAAGTIAAVNIGTGGSGYTGMSPTITIAAPGFSTTNQATATLTVVGDSVSSGTITNGGAGYTSTNPPNVLIEEPDIIKEIVSVSTYSGDQGEVVGFGTTATGEIGSLDLYIPEDSFLRDPFYAGIAVTVSLIEAGDVIVINNANITNVGSTEPMNGIYTVQSATTVNKNIPQLGFTTAIRRVEIMGVGFGSTNFSSTAFTFDNTGITWDSQPASTAQSYIQNDGRVFADYSFGKIQLLNRDSSKAKSFTAQPYNNLSNSVVVARENPLKYVGYGTQ